MLLNFTCHFNSYHLKRLSLTFIILQHDAGLYIVFRSLFKKNQNCLKSLQSAHLLLEAISSTWHDGKKLIQLSKLALHCTCNLHSVCIVLVTGWLAVTAWMMMNWRLMTVISQSVSTKIHLTKNVHCFQPKKYSYYANIMLNASVYLLCSKLCQHNVPKPIHCTQEQQKLFWVWQASFLFCNLYKNVQNVSWKSWTLLITKFNKNCFL